MQMDLDDKKRIRANFKALVKNVRCVDIEDFLYQEGILTNEDLESLSPRLIEPTRAMRVLLRLLPNKGARAFSVFCNALRDDEKDSLVELLLNTDVSKVDYCDLEITSEEKLQTMQVSIRAQIDLIQMQNHELDLLRGQLKEREKDQAAQSSQQWNDKVAEMQKISVQGITEESVVAFLQERMIKQDMVDGPSRSTSSMSLLDTYMPVFAQQWVGQGSTTKRSTDDICKIVGPDIVQYLVSKDSAPAPPNKYAAKMRLLVVRIATKHEDKFNEFIHTLDISELAGLQAFANVANEMFEGYSADNRSIWGHIGTLYAFGGYVAHTETGRGDMDIAKFIGDFLGFFVSRRLGSDIDRLGGWDNFLDYYNRSPSTSWTASIHTLAAIILWLTDQYSKPPEARLST